VYIGPAMMVRIPGHAPKSLVTSSQVVNGERPSFVPGSRRTPLGVRRAGGIDHRQWIADVGVTDLVEALEPRRPYRDVTRKRGGSGSDFELSTMLGGVATPKIVTEGGNAWRTCSKRSAVRHDDGRLRVIDDVGHSSALPCQLMGTVAAPSADVANAASKNSWLFRSRSATEPPAPRRVIVDQLPLGAREPLTLGGDEDVAVHDAGDRIFIAHVFDRLFCLTHRFPNSADCFNGR